MGAEPQGFDPVGAIPHHPPSCFRRALPAEDQGHQDQARRRLDCHAS